MVFSIQTISICMVLHGIVLLQRVILITIFGQPIIRRQVTMTILSSRRFTILVLSALRCLLPMPLQVLPQRVSILQNNQSSMLTVQAIGTLFKITSVIISGQTAARQLLSISLFRAIATSMMVRSSSTIPVTIGRQFRTTRATAAT